MVKQRIAGRTGISISELGLGCASFWAKPTFPEAKAQAVVEAAIAHGISFFDTSPSYSDGNAERRLGAVLRRHRSTPGLTVSSKTGTLVSSLGRPYKNWSPRSIRESVHRSLERLGLERLDFLHLHGPQVADLTPELLGTLEDMRGAGLFRFLGLNSFDDPVIRACLALPSFDSFMIEYNFLKKRNAALIAEIAAADRAVLVGSPIGQALYSSKIFRPTSLKGLWELARALKNHRGELATAARYRFLDDLPGMSGAQAAIAFVLRHDKIATAVFGTTDLGHLAQNVAASGLVLPEAVAARIERLADAG